MNIRKAFTLIEIMIVITILGLAGVMAVKQISNKVSSGDEQVNFFNELIAEQYKVAVETSTPIRIKGFKGSANLEKKDLSRVSIPGVRSVQKIKINDKSLDGLEYSITVYPNGISDYFELVLDNGYKIVSSPLLMTVSKVKE